MQNEIRDRFNKYLNDTGARLNVIGKNLNIPHYILGRFRRGADMWDDQLIRLGEYMAKQNY